jgi:hypothetical protein
MRRSRRRESFRQLTPELLARRLSLAAASFDFLRTFTLPLLALCISTALTLSLPRRFALAVVKIDEAPGRVEHEPALAPAGGRGRADVPLLLLPALALLDGRSRRQAGALAHPIKELAALGGVHALDLVRKLASGLMAAYDPLQGQLAGDLRIFAPEASGELADLGE